MKRNYNLTGHGLWHALWPACLLLAACAGNPSPPQPAATAPDTQHQADAYRESAPVRNNKQPLPLREDAPLKYVVKKGDTLWDIAGYFLRDPWYWPELWYANPDIDNPHLIYPGDILYLVYVDGRPQLRRRPGERLSPRVRELSIDDAIPVIPIDAIRQFLRGPRLVTQEQIEGAPYILQFLEEHLLGGAGTQVYLRRTEPEDGRIYSVVRPGDAYVDPQTGEILGYEAAPIGTVEISEFDDISTGVLSETLREALIGDRLLPAEAELLAGNFYPKAPDQPVSGQIISVYGGVSQIGQYQIVTLNRGKRAGLERGHVLSVFQAGEQTVDPITGEQLTLPELRAGTLLVFKVEDRVSFGLIMRAERSIHVLDGVRNPEG